MPGYVDLLAKEDKLSRRLADFHAHLLRLPVSTNTRIAYRYQVRTFLFWLSTAAAGADSMTSPETRDSAVQEYKQLLKQNGAKATTINSALTAISAFYNYVGIGGPHVKREQIGSEKERRHDANAQTQCYRE